MTNKFQFSNSRLQLLFGPFENFGIVIWSLFEYCVLNIVISKL
jgi:hypothetical protein